MFRITVAPRITVQRGVEESSFLEGSELSINPPLLNRCRPLKATLSLQDGMCDRKQPERAPFLDTRVLWVWGLMGGKGTANCSPGGASQLKDWRVAESINYCPFPRNKVSQKWDWLPEVRPVQAWVPRYFFPSGFLEGQWNLQLPTRAPSPHFVLSPQDQPPLIWFCKTPHFNLKSKASKLFLTCALDWHLWVKLWI